jgi:hypothetical protein
VLCLSFLWTSVTIQTGRRWDRGLIRGWGRIFFSIATSRLVVGPSAACCSLGTDRPTVSLAVK